MREFNRKGFAVAGFVGLLALVLMVGVVGFATYSTLNQNKDAASHASEGTDPTIGEDGAVATPANMGLKVIPSLLPGIGKIKVQVSWNTISDPDLNHFRLSVRRSADSTLVSPKDQVTQDKNLSTKTFDSIELVNGQEYTVALRAVYQKNGKISVKVQSVNLQYFSDDFSSSSLSPFWKAYKLGNRGYVTLSNSVLNLTANPYLPQRTNKGTGGGVGNAGLAFVSHQFQSPVSIYDSQFVLNKVSYFGNGAVFISPGNFGDENSSAVLLGVDNSKDGKLTLFPYLGLSRNSNTLLNCLVSYPYDSTDNVASNLPFALEIYSSGSNIKFVLNGQTLPIDQTTLDKIPTTVSTFGMVSQGCATNQQSITEFKGFKSVWVE